MKQYIHQDQPVLTYGSNLEVADLVFILIHGRGANAESMFDLAAELDHESVSFLIPQAALNRWYPQSAFGPIELNEPDLSSALAKIDSLVDLAKENGFTKEQIIIGGFSQGACLAAEFVARKIVRFGGLFIFSGALIGPRGETRSPKGSFSGMPVMISGSAQDPWIPSDLLQDAALFFERFGANVDFQSYPGMSHTINQDEVFRARNMLARIKTAAPLKG